MYIVNIIMVIQMIYAMEFQAEDTKLNELFHYFSTCFN